MRMPSFIAAGLFALTSSTMAVAAAPHNGIPAGNYVGYGDGSVVVFHVFPGGKQASIAAVEAGPRQSQKPFTPKDVLDALKGGAYKGKLIEVSPDHYRFVLGTPAHRNSYCVHEVRFSSQGVFLSNQNESQVGCAYYHGASWSFSPPTPAPFRPYKLHP